METEYDKVCPGCGKAASLPTVFCASCGHRFRTVFQDTPAGVSAQQVSSTNWMDSKWAPALFMIIPILLVILWLGSHQPAASVDQSASSSVASSSIADPLSTIHVGQSPDQIRGILGTPDSMAGDTWYYKLGGRMVQIKFGVNGLVENFSTY